MANPADEAAVAAARANEAASRTYATGIMKAATENYQLFKESAEQKLAERYVMYAKSGNVSTGTQAVSESGVAVGSPVSEEWGKQRADLNKTIADLQAQMDKLNPKSGEHKELEENLKSAQDTLAAMGTSAENLSTIRSNAATGHLSGSDLLTEVSFRDLAQRHGYTQMRSAENQAAAAIQKAEDFNTQANYLEDAATWNTWSSILGVGLTILGGVLSVTGLPALGIAVAGAGGSMWAGGTSAETAAANPGLA
jgi:paraquat-inducible protein B